MILLPNGDNASLEFSGWLTAYTLDNTEVFMMLAPRIIEVAVASNGDQYGQAVGLVSLRIVEAADSLQQVIKKTNVLADDREGVLKVPLLYYLK